MEHPEGIAGTLVRLSGLVQRIYADTCADHDLSPAQAQLLCVVKDRPHGMTELTRMLGLAKPGLSGLVDRTERRGLVSRGSLTTDRRAVIITPTARGKETVEAFYAAVSARLHEAVAHLSADDRREFARIASAIAVAGCSPPGLGLPPGSCAYRP